MWIRIWIRILLISSLTFKTPRFSAYYFLKVHLHHFLKIISRNQGFSYYNFCLVTEGSGSISWRPKNIGSGFWSGSATLLSSVKLSPRRDPPPKWTPPPCGETLNLQSGGAPPPTARGSAWSAPGAPAPCPQEGFGYEFIRYGSESSMLGWIPIRRFRIQSGSRVFMTKI
jgi:hypothetical protein